MANEKHTPGPWFASEYLDNGEWGVIQEDNTIVVGLASRITESNAHLIAASPDLLTACEALVEEMSHCLGAELIGNPMYAQTRKAYTEKLRDKVIVARAAIAKARGETVKAN